MRLFEYCSSSSQYRYQRHPEDPSPARTVRLYYFEGPTLHCLFLSKEAARASFPAYGYTRDARDRVLAPASSGYRYSGRRRYPSDIQAASGPRSKRLVAAGRREAVKPLRISEGGTKSIERGEPHRELEQRGERKREGKREPASADERRCRYKRVNESG